MEGGFRVPFVFTLRSSKIDLSKVFVMQVTREDLNTCTVRLNIVCDADQVANAFDRALKAIAKEVKLPGFRPGHAPKQMVEKMVSQDELYRQAADELVRRTFSKAVEAEKLEADPGVRPSVEMKDLNREAGSAEYSAKVPLAPKIELAEYKGLEGKRPPIAVTDEEVTFQIDELRKRQGSREAITDRSAAEGDYGVVNLKMDGEKGEGKNFMVVLGQTFPELDTALTGMNAEEMNSLELTFPAEFADKNYAGKTVKTQVTLNSLSAVKLPELNEEFAKALQTESVEELKVRMRDSISQAKEQMTRDMLQDQLLEDLRQKSKVEVSDNMWEALANQRLSEIANDQARQGKSFEAYAQENGMSVDELVAAWHEQAKVHVERAMVVREIFAAEKLNISNEELNRELFFMAREMQVEPMELLQAMQKQNSLQELQFRAISRKVTDFLIANANIVEIAEGEETKPKAVKKNAEGDAEKPAQKKPAAKKKND
jgi:trigger factor